MYQKQVTTFLIIIVSVIILSGVYFRSAQYATGRSLWLDEAMLALNIANKSYIELTQPLDRNQGAPIGFLFAEKSLVNLLGNRDSIYRILPFVASIFSLFLMYYLSRSIVGVRGALLALGLFSLSTPMIYYASEVKQYSSDVTFSLLLLFVAIKCIDEKADKKHFFLLGIFGSISLFFSHPSVFIMAGIGVCLLFDVFVKKDSRKCFWIFSVFFSWIVVFVTLYFISLRSLAANDALTNYWSSGFMPMPPWQDIAWFKTTFLQILYNPVGLTTNIHIKYLAILLILLGAISFTFKKWEIALLLTIPLILLLVASGLEKYPFKGRLILFVVPLVFIMLSEGVESIHQLISKYNTRLASLFSLILFVVLMFNPSKKVIENLNDPNMPEHIKPVLKYVKNSKLDQDDIYVYYGAIPAFEFYAPIYGYKENIVYGISSRQNPTNYISDISKLSREKRTWFIFSHNCSWCKVNEEKFIIEQLSNHGKRIDEFVSNGSSAYLYDLKKK